MLPWGLPPIVIPSESCWVPYDLWWCCWWVTVNCFLVCRFSGESLAYASDDGVVVGIIFLVEGITMIEDLNLKARSR